MVGSPSSTNAAPLQRQQSPAASHRPLRPAPSPSVLRSPTVAYVSSPATIPRSQRSQAQQLRRQRERGARTNLPTLPAAIQQPTPPATQGPEVRGLSVHVSEQLPHPPSNEHEEDRVPNRQEDPNRDRINQVCWSLVVPVSSLFHDEFIFRNMYMRLTMQSLLIHHHIARTELLLNDIALAFGLQMVRN